MLALPRVRVFPREARDFFQFTALLIEKFMKSRAKMHGIKLSLKVRFQFTKHFQYRNIQFSRRFQFTSPTDVRVSIYQQISIYRLSGISTYQHNFNFNLLCVQTFNFNLPAQYQFTDCAVNWNHRGKLKLNWNFTSWCGVFWQLLLSKWKWFGK